MKILLAPFKCLVEKIAYFFNKKNISNKSDLLEEVKQARKGALIDAEVQSIIEGALQVSEMQVREVMVPRINMVSIKLNDDVKKSIATIIQSGHSRFPVLGDQPDDVLGILLAKDLLQTFQKAKLERSTIKDKLRQTTFIPESKRLNVLLKEFQTNRNHMAIVLNEFGSVAGLVTIEDVIEQIIGEITDEHDLEELEQIKAHGNNQFVVKSTTPIDEFNDFFSCHFSDDEFETIGGIVINQFGYLPKRDEMIEFANFHFRVVKADSRSIRLLNVEPLA